MHSDTSYTEGSGTGGFARIEGIIEKMLQRVSYGVA